MSTDQRSPFSLPNLSGSPLVDPTNVYCGVAIDANGNGVLPAAGASIVGVVYGISTTGNALSVRGCGDGKVKAQYGGTVTLPAILKCNASGQFITASASDIAAGSATAVALEPGAVGEIHPVILLPTASAVGQVNGLDDIVLGTTPPSNVTTQTFVQTTGTKTGVLANGVAVGQTKRFTQSVATGSPVGTITGAFKDWTGAAKTTLALGTAVGTILDVIWDGAAWRQTSALGGTASSLS